MAAGKPLPTHQTRAKPLYEVHPAPRPWRGDRENHTSALYRRCDLYLSPTVAMKAPTNTVGDKSSRSSPAINSGGTSWLAIGVLRNSRNMHLNAESGPMFQSTKGSVAPGAMCQRKTGFPNFAPVPRFDSEGPQRAGLTRSSNPPAMSPFGAHGTQAINASGGSRGIENRPVSRLGTEVPQRASQVFLIFYWAAASSGRGNDVG